MNTHKGIVNRLLWMQETFQIGVGDTLVQKTPFSFDVSVWEFFWPFMYGARLVVAKPEGHKDADYLLNLIQREKITVIHFVPSMLRLFLDKANQSYCASLKHVVLSGEALSFDLQRLYFTVLKIPLHNLYGPTEAAVDVSYWKCDPQSQNNVVPIGRPISNTTLYILDDKGQPVPIGESGELHIGGVQLARGYLNRPELTAEKFIPDPFADDHSARLYKTGDLCRFLPDGNIEYLGRIDFQVKIRGNRIELGEIEAAIRRDNAVKDCAVMVREDTPGEMRLVAYIVQNENRFSLTAMRERLAAELPDYMIPAVFVSMPALPLSPSGKTDRLALPKPGRKRPELANRYIAPRTQTERKLVHVWCEILQLDSVGIEDNFFALGGDSLMGLKMCSRFHSEYGIKLPVVKLFQFPSIILLSAFLDNTQVDDNFIDEVNERATRQRIGRFQNDPLQDGVAIIGMAGRFPGAQDISQLWNNLCDGIESITRFSKEELGPGIDQALIDNPDYVRARGIIEEADLFDAAFFGIGPMEAKLMDPQHRIFLELCWTAMENAGYDSESFAGMIGVYAGVGDNHYYPNNVLAHPDLVNMVGSAIVGYGNEKDYIATRVSYCLNLTGPGVSANTGCSTTLLAVDNAFNALINYECDMALAGGADVYVPQKSGFLYQDGGVFSKDGHCKPFEDSATGTMFCDGAGVVVMKRLADAIADGDRIYAIVRGSAKNNDGANKVSFLAPSVEGQAKAIAMAQALANVEPEDISYIEAHGTGTPLGDPIEIEALTKVFRYNTDKKQFCLLGSIKGNIGHPTIASGVAGVIKTALCLYHEKIPGTLHFHKPNARIDFENSPFVVVDKLTPWPRSNRPRIAGISSFGFGGTNVHSIVEEAPVAQPSGASRPVQLLLLSARTATALEQNTSNLKTYLSEKSEEKLPDISYTLQRGRRYHAHRRYLVCKDIPDAVNMLVKPDPMRSQTRICETRDPRLVFIFPGQGTQYVNMGKDFYDHEPLFKSTLDQCCDILQPHLGCDLRNFLFPEEHDYEKASQSLQNTFYTQPALFTIEYSLARLLQHWGIRPSAMIGHSVGEFVCACLAGVFSLKDALRLVATRGHLISDLPSGAMLSVRLNAEEIEARLPQNIQLAAANSPSLCVVSGPHEAISQFGAELMRDNIPCKKLYTSHAFHSAMMDPVVDKFIAEVAKAELKPPQIPFVSTVTTKWISDKDATDPAYWGRHLRMPVRFSNGIRELLKENPGIFLEVGPRSTGTTLARQHGDAQNKILASPTMAESYSVNAEWTALLSAVGYLWSNGLTMDWRKFYEHEIRHRIPLPTYSFERKKYWVDYIPRGSSQQVSTCVEADDEQDAVIAPAIYEIIGQDKIAQKLITIFEEASGLSFTGIDPSTTFLEMGMDSLLLSQIAYKIQKDFGVRLVFSQMMRNISTIPLLSDYVQANRKEADRVMLTPESETSGNAAESVQGLIDVPVTIPQRGLLLSSQLNPALSCAYNESIALNFIGEMDFDALEKAIYALVKKHDALRATFAADGSTMIISDKIIYERHRIDLRKSSETQSNAQFDSILKQDASTPFDLENGPLFRCHLILLPANQCYVIMTSHHVVCDGWSLDVLIADLLCFYRLLHRGQTLNIKATYKYADYCRQAVRRIISNEFRISREYWRDRFNPVFPVLRLPADKPGPKTGVYDARRVDLDIQDSVVDSLKKLCKRKGWSMFTLFVAAYTLLLHKISGQKYFVIGLPIAEQNLLGQDDLVGHCVNLLPFYCSIKESNSYEEHIETVQRDLLDAYNHQIYTYVHLLNEGGIVYDHTGAAPLPAGLTSVKKYETEDLLVPGARASYFANPRAYESFELYLNVIESQSKLELKCHYKTAFFNHDTIRNWLQAFERILTLFAQEPSARVETLRAARPVQIEQRQKGINTDHRTSTTSQLAESLTHIWKKLLGKTEIHPDDNFFEIGGNSLLAAKVIAEIEKLLKRHIPLSVLYETPTVSKLAKLLSNGDHHAYWDSLVEIQATGNHPPIFFVHSEDGNVIEYLNFAKYLGTDQPFYGIQAQGLSGENIDHKTIESMARHYVSTLKKKQPHGPYYLGGYCLGGMIAFEMANQLEQQGERIAFLGIISTATRQYLETLQPGINVFKNIFYKVKLRTGIEWTNLNALDRAYKILYIKDRFSIIISKVKFRLEDTIAEIHQRFVKSGYKHSRKYQLEKLKNIHNQAYFDYEFPVIRTKVTLFRPEKQHMGLVPDPSLGLKDLTKGGLESIGIDCYHKNILLEPNVKTVADLFKERLENARPSSDTAPAPASAARYR